MAEKRYYGEWLQDAQGKCRQRRYRSKAKPAAAWTKDAILKMMRAPKRVQNIYEKGNKNRFFLISIY